MSHRSGWEGWCVCVCVCAHVGGKTGGWAGVSAILDSEEGALQLHRWRQIADILCIACLIDGSVLTHILLHPCCLASVFPSSFPSTLYTFFILFFGYFDPTRSFQTCDIRVNKLHSASFISADFLCSIVSKWINYYWFVREMMKWSQQKKSHSSQASKLATWAQFSGDERETKN